MSIEVNYTPSLEDGAFLFMSADVQTSRTTKMRFHGPETTDRAAVEASADKLRAACPLVGECALSATCQEVKYDVSSPYGWMQTETEHFLAVNVSDEATNCPQPNAHLEVFNAVAEARGHERYDLEA